MAVAEQNARVAEREHRRRHRPDTRQQMSQMDQELRAAKNAEQFVQVDLAVEAEYVDQDCVCRGMVMFVDKYAIKMQLTHPRACTKWIPKAFIVGAEVLA